AEGHAYAAVRGRISGQRTAMQCEAVPGDALQVRHPGIVIHVRAVVRLPLDDGEDARRRLASLGAGGHRRAQDPAVGVVESDPLGLDRHDRHEQLACLARRRLLFGWRGTPLLWRRVGGQRRQRDRCRERHNGRRPPAPQNHRRSRRRRSIHHVIPGWNACPRLRRSSVTTPYIASSFLGTIALRWYFLHITIARVVALHMSAANDLPPSYRPL